MDKDQTSGIKFTSSSPQIDQVKILRPSVHFNLNLRSAACKMLYSDWLNIQIQNQVNILPPKRIWGEDVNLVRHRQAIR